MSRPPGTAADSLVDANVCARAASTIERHFSVDDLPRLAAAGARGKSAIDASFRFSLFDDRPAVDGRVCGCIVLTCQRCMQGVPVPIDESFQVVVVAQERSDEPGGYEPVIADAARFDLRWLAEDQVLLALPLVPVHESEECANVAIAPVVEERTAAVQKPFQNLRDMLRQR
jgi:uncharacterized protein